MIHRATSKDGHGTHRQLAQPLINIEQTSRSQVTTDIHVRASPLKFFASSLSSVPKPAMPADSEKKWKTEYLADLRFNRPARPSGSRPLPDRGLATSSASVAELPLRTTSAMSRPLCSTRQTGYTIPAVQDRNSSALSSRRAESAVSTPDACIQPVEPGIASQMFPTSTEASTVARSIAYREGGLRWMEKQEARSLREALEDMDLQDEARTHAAAQDEASELIMQHKSSRTLSQNPEGPFSYKQHLRKGSHARSQSVGRYAELGIVKGSREQAHQSISDTSTLQKSDSDASKDSRVSSGSSAENGKASVDATTKGYASLNSSQRKAYTNPIFSIISSSTIGRRRTSGPKSRNESGGLFRNPDDKIYEEPEEIKKDAKPGHIDASPVPEPLKLKVRNPGSQIQPATQWVGCLADSPLEAHKKYSKSEIHMNLPSQSRNPSYTRNALPPMLPPDVSDSDIQVTGPGTKDGIEIRGDDIRAATSLRMKDRSPKLPSPTVASNQKGRPIVSFDQNWKPRETELKKGDFSLSRPSSSDGTSKPRSTLHPRLRLPESTASAPAIPTINVPEPPAIHVDHACDTPSINIPPVPSISFSTPNIPIISVQDSSNSSRPLPTPSNKPRSKPFQRPLPHHSSTAPTQTSTRHWSPSPSNQRATAQCAACALPISGRIVSAVSQRFHPACFTCFHCAELLECVAFYPEPTTAHGSRLARIEARANSTHLSETENETWEDDGDTSLRFFCHLDFHEKFSPRCRSCKTPIEGEVVLACGGEWHVGHFFCAECGDPFDPQTPFVEKEGFAWCVGCHTRRFSGKCRGCRKPVVDVVVRALGGEWHEGCFCCGECGGGFEDGRFFTRGVEEVPVCVGCEERRLKA